MATTTSFLPTGVLTGSTSLSLGSSWLDAVVLTSRQLLRRQVCVELLASERVVWSARAEELSVPRAQDRLREPPVRHGSYSDSPRDAHCDKGRDDES
jgi:hypothetical protein